MAIYFFDTSGLAKRYVTEVGTPWVQGVLDPAAGSSIYVAAITAVEVVAAIARRRAGRTVSPADASTMLADFRLDLNRQCRTVDLTRARIDRAMALADQYSLRGYDAIQFACALAVHASSVGPGGALTLVSAGAELNAAAGAEGVPVENPNLHP